MVRNSGVVRGKGFRVWVADGVRVGNVVRI